MRIIQTLSPGYYRPVYQLLKESSFPDLPKTYEDTVPKLRNANHLGWLHEGKLLLWVGIFHDNGEYFVDIACKPALHRRWATKAVIRELITLLFSITRGLPLCTIPRTPSSLHFCKRLGFRKKGNTYVLEHIRQVPIFNH